MDDLFSMFKETPNEKLMRNVFNLCDELYLELIFRMFNNIEIFNISILYVIIFDLFMTLLICIIGKLLNRRVNKIMFLSGLFLLGLV